MASYQSRFLVRSNHNHLWSSQRRRDMLEDSEGSQNGQVAGEQAGTKDRAQRAQEAQPGECRRHSLTQGPPPRATLTCQGPSPLTQEAAPGMNI